MFTLFICHPPLNTDKPLSICNLMADIRYNFQHLPPRTIPALFYVFTLQKTAQNYLPLRNGKVTFAQQQPYPCTTATLLLCSGK